MGNDSTSSARIIRSIDELDIEFLQHALSLRSISSFVPTLSTSDSGGEQYRLQVVSPDTEPQPLVLKLGPHSTPATSGTPSLGMQEREIRFFVDLAPIVSKSAECLPRCYHAAYDPLSTAFTLLLEDCGYRNSAFSDVEGASLDQAQVAIFELGRLHSPFLVDPMILTNSNPWLANDVQITQQIFENLFEEFLGRYRFIIVPQYLSICEALVRNFDALRNRIQTTCTLGLIHGDYRLENLRFTSEENALRGGPGILIADWQTIASGPILSDVALFLGTSLTTDNRRLWQENLLQTYCDALGEVDGEPVLSLEKCKQDLRMQAFFGIVMALVSSKMAAQTESGSKILMTMLSRHCEMVLDLAALEILPKA